MYKVHGEPLLTTCHDQEAGVSVCRTLLCSVSLALSSLSPQPLSIIHNDDTHYSFLLDY